MSEIVRVNEEPELLETMTAHSGVCKHCQGIVKMGRDPNNFKLRADHCWCFNCGQRYFMNILHIESWEMEQWVQKQNQMRNEDHG